MTKIHRHVILAAPALLLACTEPGADACAAANRDINLGTLASNTFGGSYDQCLSDLRSEIAAVRLENRELQAKADALRRESASLTDEKRRLLAEEAALREDINRLSADDSPSPADVARVKQRQQELNRRFAVVFG